MGAIESSAMNVACACAGAGARIPAWWGPSNGTLLSNSSLNTARDCAAALRWLRAGAELALGKRAAQRSHSTGSDDGQ